jgi:hypothetical protein
MDHIRFVTLCVLCSGLSLTGTLFIWSKNGAVRDDIAFQKSELQRVLQEVEMLEQEVLIVPTPEIVSPIEEVVPSAEGESEEVVILPSRFLLEVPFTSQAPEKNWDQPWQDACEEAAILMLDAYYKKYSLSPLFAKTELQKMVDWESAKGWGGSVEIEKVKMTAQWYMGKGELKIVENPTVEDIKRSIANNHPVLVVADGKVLPNPNFRSGGPLYHALVVIGYDDATGEFVTNDPGTQFGAGFKYKYDDLMNSIRDWNGGDVKSGKRVVLVVQ